MPHSLRECLRQLPEPRRHRLLGSAPRLPLDEAIAIVVVIGVVLANLVADLLYAAVNSRIRYR